MGISNEIKEIFSEHMINETLKKDYEKVINSEGIKQFIKRNEYKSAKTKEADEKLVNSLLFKLNQYRQGWTKANMLKTAELWNKSQMLDKQREALIQDAESINGKVNDMIVQIKDKVPESALKSLRELEIKMRKI